MPGKCRPDWSMVLQVLVYDMDYKLISFINHGLSFSCILDRNIILFLPFQMFGCGHTCSLQLFLVSASLSASLSIVRCLFERATANGGHIPFLHFWMRQEPMSECKGLSRGPSINRYTQHVRSQE